MQKGLRSSSNEASEMETFKTFISRALYISCGARGTADWHRSVTEQLYQYIAFERHLGRWQISLRWLTPMPRTQSGGETGTFNRYSAEFGEIK